MPRAAAAGFWSRLRACAGAARRCLDRPSRLAAGMALLGSIFAGACHAADAIRGEATFAEAGGYARLVLKLAEDVDSEVSVAGSIIVIRFRHPVDIPIDALADPVPAYVGSA